MDAGAVLRAFGETLRRARERAGLTQERLALVCELDRAFLNGIEMGRRNPSLVSVVRLAHALGVRPTALMRTLPGPPAKRSTAVRTPRGRRAIRRRAGR